MLKRYQVKMTLGHLVLFDGEISLHGDETLDEEINKLALYAAGEWETRRFLPEYKNAKLIITAEEVQSPWWWD